MPADKVSADKPKVRRNRTPSQPRDAFFIIQVLDEAGQPMPFEKKRLRIVSVERDAARVMDMVDNAEVPHAVYLRGKIPVARRTAAPGVPVSG